MTFEVLREATAVADPGEGPFDDPALGQANKAVQIGALDERIHADGGCQGPKMAKMVAKTGA